MKPVVIFGVGQIAEVFTEALRRATHRIAGYVADATYLDGGTVSRDYPRAALEWVEDTFDPEQHLFVIAMSFQGLNKPRAEKFEQMLAKGYMPATCLMEMDRMDDGVEIDPGTVVLTGNCIQTGTKIGKNCILWNGNHIGHHTKIGNHVFIASHVVISGAVEIGDYCFIGVNATIRDGVKIGEGCIIGAGATIMSDCEPNGLYPGPRTERSKLPADKLRRI